MTFKPQASGHRFSFLPGHPHPANGHCCELGIQWSQSRAYTLELSPDEALPSRTESFPLEFPVYNKDTSLPVRTALVNMQGCSGNASCLFSLLWTPSHPEQQPSGKEKLFPRLEHRVEESGWSSYMKGGSVQNQSVLGLD